MTEDPIDLDGRRTVADRVESEMRRRPANDAGSLTPSAQPPPGSIEDQMSVEPARTWVAVMQKWRFLLERYAATPEAQEERVQKLISRAMGDMERLRKREERKER